MSATFIIPLTIFLAVYTSSNVKTNTSTLEEVLLTKANALAREGAASLAQVLETAIDSAGSRICGAQLDIVEMNPPDMPSALAIGSLGAYFVGEPFAAQTIRSGKSKVL
jgi:hypothetical protein